MMGNGMPNSHSKIPLPMLIHSRYYDDNTDAQRFDRDGGSAIHVDDCLDRAALSYWVGSSSNRERRMRNALSSGLRRLTRLSAIVRRTT